MLYIVVLDTLDHKDQKAKWVLQEEEAQKEKKEMKGSAPASLVP